MSSILNSPGTKTNYSGPFAVVTSLFFMWGFITVLVDSLIPRVREMFELSYFESGIVQVAFFMAYGLVSIPAGGLLSKIGFKKGMLIGLLTMGIGCLLFWPSAASRSFPLFLLAIFTLASGMTVLQVAANPYVSVLGAAKNASSRLNLSQAFNSLGTTIAPIIGAVYILSDNILSGDEITALSDTAKSTYFAAEASAVQGPFIVLAICLLALGAFVAIFKLPTVLSEEADGSYGDVLKQPRLLLGAIGIFVYVGAEVTIGSYLVNYFLDMDMASAIKSHEGLRSLCTSLLGSDLSSVDPKGIVGAFVAFYWLGAMIGRFIGAGLTRVFAPGAVLSVFGLAAITLIIVSMSTTGFTSMWSILGVGLFNSIMFPTIFTLAIDKLGGLKPKGSGVLCTAIVGGAVIPPLYGLLVDTVSFKPAFFLVIACYIFIAWYGYKYSEKPEAAIA